ncbi:MAG: gliding motility-associated protein GldE [Candidatus Amulumruptor caecigallinarius]|nr:gliding motility-associated protein GldE [Candidatus Amulumruptor caecigallinarius]MCM1397224.1 gliding motility-associated protein GldE [Candidatus Amulumruptor caecigallinarius]MCM1454779.1 gliding motility-associated protein GldE [bacterium]
MDFDPLGGDDPLLCLISGALTLAMPETFSVPQIIALVCAVVALILSGFVSGSEIAFFSLRPEQIEELEDENPSSRILRLIGAPERLLATILIANNLVNVTIVVLFNFALGPVFEGLAPWLSFVLQTVILTFLILLFGEILPKLYATNNNLTWARFAAPGISAMMGLFWPVSAVLVKSSWIVKRVISKPDDTVTADDLSHALEITDVKNSDTEMLEGILRFGDTTASEIMTPRVDITDVDADSPFEEVMKTVIDSGYSRLPVCEGSQDDIKGILYARDLLPYIGVEPPKEFAWQSLLREPYFVPESRRIDDLLEDFRRRRIHLAIVIDEYGGTQGLVTMEDILEEIVGDIDDEYDTEEKTYKRLPDDTYIFDGKTLLNDFFRVTGLDEDDYKDVAEDCETLAGMLLAIKGDFPRDKEPLVYGRCRFLVLDVNHHRIAQVRVKVMPEVQSPASLPAEPNTEKSR